MELAEREAREMTKTQSTLTRLHCDDENGRKFSLLFSTDTMDRMGVTTNEELVAMQNRVRTTRNEPIIVKWEVAEV